MEHENPLKGKQSKGMAFVAPYGGHVYGERGECRAVTMMRDTIVGMALPEWGDQTAKANAALYTEAHNVANTSGLWPAEMAAALQAAERRVKEMENGLQALIDHCAALGVHYGYPEQRQVTEARALLSPKEDKNI